MDSLQLPRIAELRAYCDANQAVKSADQGADCHNVADQHWINGFPTPISNPMSSYPQYRAARKSWGINALGSVVVEVVADDGTTGVGVSIGGLPACSIVENHLARFVVGQNPNSIELMHDQMMRATLNYGRKGLAVQAVSAVDLALWDLLGKLRKAPVFELLGGPVRPVLPVYCTTARPDVAKALGFVGAKIPCPHGPSEGDIGLKKNVEFVKSWREKLGEDYPLALDCYMSLTVPYTLRLCKLLAPLNVKWVEEFLPPDDYDGYAEVYEKVAGSVLLTTGEHEYTAKGFQLLIDKKCCDVLQPDVTWVGGITECRKIIALAHSKGKLVIPHGSSVYSYHLQLAFPNTPMAEFINLHPTGDGLAPYFGGLFPDEPLPVGGKIFAADLGKRSGFGVTLDKTKLHRPCAADAAEVAGWRKRNLNPDSGVDAHQMPF
jgi:L-rhamnonate dehydratase